MSEVMCLVANVGRTMFNAGAAVTPLLTVCPAVPPSFPSPASFSNLDLNDETEALGWSSSTLTEWSVGGGIFGPF